MGIGYCAARRLRTACSNPHDGLGHRPRSVTVSNRQRRSRPRDRRPDGDCDSWRACDFNSLKPTCVADARLTVWSVYATAHVLSSPRHEFSLIATIVKPILSLSFTFTLPPATLTGVMPYSVCSNKTSPVATN